MTWGSAGSCRAPGCTQVRVSWSAATMRRPSRLGSQLAFGRSFADTVDLAMDSLSSMLSGEAFLTRVYGAYRSATSGTGANVWNTALLIGWDEPGGTYDHVPPGPVPPPDPAAPPGEFGFRFDRSGYRVPAVIVSPSVEPGSAYSLTSSIVDAALNELCVPNQDPCDNLMRQDRGIICPAAICLKPLPERSASIQECPLRSTSWVARQAGH